jgi:hypothetical protein
LSHLHQGLWGRNPSPPYQLCNIGLWSGMR